MRRVLAGVLTLVLAMLTIVAGAPAASAATPGITAELQLNGTTYDGVPVVTEGDELTLKVQYTQEVTPGSTIEFELGANITLTAVPSGNTAIANVVKDGNKVRITFADPWPTGIDQGVFDLKFTVNPVVNSSHEQLTWTIAGEPTSVDVIVRDSNDQFANVTNGQDKRVSPTNLNSLVTYAADGTVTLSTDVLSRKLTYTLQVDSADARDGLTISDLLPAGLTYDPTSFKAELMTWDADGLNRTTDPFAYTPSIAADNGSFTSSVTLPEDSILTITYDAVVADEAARLVLQQKLQEAANARGGEAGGFNIKLTNEATFGTVTETATAQINGSIPAAPGPVVGNAFGKSASWSPQQVRAAEDGTLTPPLDITYTLTANLSQWDGRAEHANFTLTRNVVIRDALPAQASWNVSAADFITATGITLVPAAEGVVCTEPGIAASAVGSYCVDGQVLLVNIGQNSSTDAAITAKAQVNTVTGSPNHPDGTTIADASAYRLRNSGQFYYRAGNPYTVDRDAKIVDLPQDADDGINDSSVFTKTGTAKDATINPGDPVVMDYTFVVAAGKGIDVSTSRIIDYIDTELFDFDNPATLQISGNYDGQTLTADHYQHGLDGDGNLVIELNTDGKEIAALRGADKRWETKITLTTLPFVGKETKAITNRAALIGEEGQTKYWSESKSEATSYGDEAEVRKTVYDAAEDEWVHTLKAQRKPDGTLALTNYTYRVEFIPHGSYNNVTIANVRDVLPAGIRFLGFVAAADAATGANPTTSTVDIGGNIEATYDEGVVTLRQKSGTRLNAAEPIAAYFAVEVVDPAATVPIVNQIGTTRAEIVPVSYAVGDFVWIDADRDGLQDAGEQVLAGVTVELLNGEGAVVGTTTTDATGRYLFDNLPAGTYQVRFTLTPEQAARYTFTGEGAGSTDADDSDAVVQTGGATGLTRKFDLDGSNTALTTGYDRTVLASEGIDPTWDAGVVLKSVSVGDFVWVDTDRDGRQDPGELGIPGVVLKLVGPDGKPVVDIDGKPVGPVTTGPNGEYSFDKLPALTGDQTYTVVIDREASADALRPYVPTRASQGNRGGDSSTWQATTEPGDLHDDGDRDPTLDFGFVAKTYAIGDLVWIDANRNGLQDDDEDVLSGVRVDLLDSEGAVIDTTTTDGNGRYLFDELAAGTYRVRFTLTDEQQRRYRFTSRDAGSDAADSDADPTTGLTITIVLDDSNTALTGDYEYAEVLATQGIDPTWDAGVVLADQPAVEEPDEDDSEDPTDNEAEDDELAFSGSNPLLPIGLGALLLTAGLVLVGIRRRGAEI